MVESIRLGLVTPAYSAVGFSRNVMENVKPSALLKDVRTTTKDTIAAFKLKDMERVFNLIDCEDYQALEKMIVSGRAFHLPEGREVQVLVPRHKDIPACKLRLMGSVTEIWASIKAISS